MQAELKSRITTAVERIPVELGRVAPRLAELVREWMVELARGQEPVEYFDARGRFPIFELPWWLSRQIGVDRDETLQRSLAYSTVNGYYYVRLVDNLMDGNSTVERDLLPAASFFHTEFQSSYQHLFPSNHRFWEFFRHTWFFSSECATRDAALESIDRTSFEEVCARKICAAKIPLAAVCYHSGRDQLLEPWGEFCDRLGCYVQMMDDLVDWQQDADLGNRTYFLSEGARRRRNNEGIRGWYVREGFAWAVASLDEWMVELRNMATDLGSDVQRYLDMRDALLREHQTKLEAGLRALNRLGSLL